MSEAVNHPEHYGGDTTYEAIKVIEAWNLDFCLGNAVKYICRAGKKGSFKEMEDLRKAAWYLNRRMEQIAIASESATYATGWCNCLVPIALVSGDKVYCKLCRRQQRIAK